MKEIKINDIQLNELFKTLKSSLSKDETRPILKWIKVEVKGDKITAISVDGYMLSTITFSISENTNEEFCFFIQPFYIPKDKNGLEITFNCENEKYVMVTIESFSQKDKLTYQFYQPDNNFIDWQKIIPETDDSLEVTVNAVRLMNLMKGYQCNLLYNNEVTLKFKRNGKGIDFISPVVFEQTTLTGTKKQSILLPIKKLR